MRQQLTERRNHEATDREVEIITDLPLLSEVYPVFRFTASFASGVRERREPCRCVRVVMKVLALDESRFREKGNTT